MIAAASENNVIGRGGKLPWHLKNDLRHFKERTTGHPVIMGRKTFESIGRPLPNRRNIVITRQNGWSALSVATAHSLEEALSLVTTEGRRQTTDEIVIIGGGEIYRQALPLAHRIYLTRVHAVIDGDAFFPQLPVGEWKEMSREEHAADSENEYPYTFLTYERQSVPLPAGGDRGGVG